MIFSNPSDPRVKQIIPAEPGWRVLCQNDDGDVELPVIAWALTAAFVRDSDDSKIWHDRVYPMCFGPGDEARVDGIEAVITPGYGWTVYAVLRPGQSADSITAEDRAEVRAGEAREREERLERRASLASAAIDSVRRMRDDIDDDPDDDDRPS